jgi:hypothetical protein
MIEWLQSMWDFHFFAVVAAIAAIVACIAMVADRHRHKRSRLDQVGFVPWTGISILATGVTLVSIALAFKVG